MTAAFEQLTAGMTGPRRRARGGGPSLGQQIINSEVGRWLLKEQKGSFPTGAWTSPASELMAATLTEDAASGGDLVITDYAPGHPAAADAAAGRWPTSSRPARPTATSSPT